MSSFIWRKKDEKYHAGCMSETVKHPLKVMVWSVISGKGTGSVYIVEGTLKQDQYVKILQTRLIPQIKKWFRHESECIFMHDSAPCHKAKSVTSFLEKKNVNVLPWPGNSPDLNPIENAWELLKRKIAIQNIKNQTDLVESLVRVWNNDEELQKNIKNCIQSMPRRVQAVIDAKGGSTKY